jgi:hypothetical protein
MKTKPIEAILIKDITYKKEGLEYLVKQYTTILVDMKLKIALVGSDHIDIHETEFEIFN